MSANPQFGAWQYDMAPTLDPQALPFPPQDVQGMPYYGPAGESMALPLNEADHGLLMGPLPDQAYAASEELPQQYAPITADASTFALPIDDSERALRRQRMRTMIIATAGVLVIAGLTFAVAWNVVRHGNKPAGTTSSQTDATGGGSDYSTDGTDGSGINGQNMNPGAMGTPPTGGAAGGAAGGAHTGASFGAPGARRGAGGGFGADAAAPSGGFGGSPAPSGGGFGGSGPAPTGGAPIAGGWGTGPASSGPRPVHDAPAVQPVNGGAPGGARPGGAGAPVGLPGIGVHPGAGAAGGAPGAAAAAAHPAAGGATPQVQGAGTAGAATTAGAAAIPAQVIIAVKTTAGTWQDYKTDPRRVVLAANAARFDTRGSMSGYVWINNAWQPAVILAQPVATGTNGGGPAGGAAATTGGGAPMKQ